MIPERHLPQVLMNPPQEDPDREPSPPLWRHLLAMVYDSLLILPLFMAAAALWVSVWGPTENALVQTVPPVVQWLSWGIILLLFFGLFWRKNGQTLGMQAWRLKLISEDGKQPTWPQVATRLLVATLSLTACGLGFIWKWMPPRYRYWHDTLSRTRLILVPKRD
jgi:uncharacterized RDD family membrane protein YckC